MAEWVQLQTSDNEVWVRACEHCGVLLADDGERHYALAHDATPTPAEANDGGARGHRCGECRLGLGRHDINDPYCDFYRDRADAPEPKGVAS